MPTTIDECQADLHRLGWSVGDALVHADGAPMWMVFAQRGENRVLAKTESQTDAWIEARRLATIGSE